MPQKRIETVEELEQHLERVTAAYRKSYKFFKRFDKTIKIMSGLLGISALTSIIPAVPIFLAATAFVPAALTVFTGTLKLSEKAEQLRHHHILFKQLLSVVRSIVTPCDDSEIIPKIFLKMLNTKKLNTIEYLYKNT